MADTTAIQTGLTANTVLCVGAHPDDIDFCMGGTVARLAAQGADVYYLILTNGNRGSADAGINVEELVRTRQDEQRRAAKIVGAKDVYYCDFDDCGLAVDDAVRREIVRIIRRVRPDLVMAMDPTVVYDAGHGIINHPDHRAAGQATLDAVYPMARDRLSFPELLDDGLVPHNTSTVLLYNTVASNYAVDMTAYMEQKLQSLAAHTSQFPDIGSVHQRVRQLAEDIGRSAGIKYAEPYVRINIF